MIQYLPTFMPNKIVIIGCGGTGSRLVPLLGQFLKTCAWIQNPEITLVDDDVVEEKNLLRQNFISIDVNKYKAEVLAQRYSRAFNIPMVPITKRVTMASFNKLSTTEAEKQTDQYWTETFGKFTNNTIFVLCVDSPEARRHIVGRILLATRSGAGNILIIDSGNENDFGQVTVSTGKVLTHEGSDEVLKMWGSSVPGELTIPGIPLDLSYFADMKSETTLSCADLDQTMAINTMMAVTMFGIIQNFYYAKPIAFHRLNVTLSHGVTPEYMNPRYLRKFSSIDRVTADRGFVGQGMDFQCCWNTIYSEIRNFHSQTFLPFKREMEKAEKIQADALRMAEEKNRKRIGEEAVAQAMLEYGWKKPAEQTVNPSETVIAKEMKISSDLKNAVDIMDKTFKSKRKSVSKYGADVDSKNLSDVIDNIKDIWEITE